MGIFGPRKEGWGGGDGCESLANTSIPEKVLYVENPSKKLIGLICATFQCETIASELGKKNCFLDICLYVLSLL